MTEKSNGNKDHDVAEPGDDAQDVSQVVDADDSADQPAGKESADDAHFDDIVEDVEIAAKPPGKPRLVAFVSIVALLISLAALAGVGFLYLKSDESPAAGGTEALITSLSDALEANDRKLDELEQSVAAIDVGDAPEPVDVDAIERRLQGRLQQNLRQLESVPARVASLESSLTSLRGISTGARDAWLLAEAEYYLQIANGQLQLANNPGLASMALKLADERIVELGDPGLTDVRRVLADEVRSLDALELPDIEGTTLTLSSLARVVDTLPLQQRIVLTGDSPAAPDEELSGTDRALASLKSAMSGVVSVRRTDEATRPLIAPEAAYFLRANLALQLQAARLAVLRGEQALFQQSLDDASAWLREYYDTESQPVRSTLQTIGEIREDTFTRAMPDISGSLRLIREYIAFIEAARIESAGTDAEAGPDQ